MLGVRSAISECLYKLIHVSTSTDQITDDPSKLAHTIKSLAYVYTHLACPFLSTKGTGCPCKYYYYIKLNPTVHLGTHIKQDYHLDKKGTQGDKINKSKLYGSFRHRKHKTGLVYLGPFIPRHVSPTFLYTKI